MMLEEKLSVLIKSTRDNFDISNDVQGLERIQESIRQLDRVRDDAIKSQREELESTYITILLFTPFNYK